MESWGMARRVLEKKPVVLNDIQEITLLNNQISRIMKKMGFETQEIWDVVCNISDVKQATFIKKIMEASYV